MENIDILLIDDSPFMEKVISGLIGDLKLSFHFCSDPEKGLQEVVDFKPKILLLDYNMPGLNGQQVIVKLSEKHIFKDTSVYLLSGEDMDEMQKLRLMTLGFTQLLQKPIDKHTFHKIIKNELGDIDTVVA
jgi:CheY-like chemotaxis protein